MPRFKVWRELPERHQVEWIMRMVATINGTGCGLASVPYVLSADFPAADLSPLSLVTLVTLGYFVYDGIGNIVYYPLLKKSYILFHHAFCFITGFVFVYGGHMSIAVVGLFTVLPDPVDHILWFLHRLRFPDRPRKMAAHANTVFFFLNRLVVGNYRFYQAMVLDPVVPRLSSWAYWHSVVAIFVFLGMNIRVLLQRLFKRHHHHAPESPMKPVTPKRD